MANFAGWRPTRSGIMYVLVALLAAGLVFAGAWYVRERGEQVRRQDAADIARQKLEEASETPVLAQDDEIAQNDSNDDEAASPNGVAGDDSASAVDNDDSEALPTTGSATELPQTGSSVWQSGLALFVTIWSIVAYVNSRRSLN